MLFAYREENRMSLKWVGDSLVVVWENPRPSNEAHIGFFDGPTISKVISHIASDYRLKRFKKRKHKMRKAK